MRRLTLGDPSLTIIAKTVTRKTATLLLADLSTPYGILLTSHAHWRSFSDARGCSQLLHLLVTGGAELR